MFTGNLCHGTLSTSEQNDHRSAVVIVSFEHMAPYSSVSIVDFEHVFILWV